MPAFDLAGAMQALAAADERLGRLIAETLEFRVESDGTESPYETLLESITYQSISGKAAETIFGRIRALGKNGKAPEPEEMLRLQKRVLRKAGLSGAKIAAMKDLARKTLDGVVPTREESEKMTDKELIDRLVSVRGIGAWTVEMYLIFRLGRPDILPIHDLGVQKGFALTYGKRYIPKPAELQKFGERWRPYRTVASWYMWRACEREASKARKIGKAPVRKKRGKRTSGRGRAAKAGKLRG